MKRVTGIGGIFFKARDATKLRAWYREHLGIEVESWGGTAFPWSGGGSTAWCVFDGESKHFEPSRAPFMLNYRVENLEALLDALRKEGVTVDPKTQVDENGKFGWAMDPEGNRVELWEPAAGH